MKYKKNIVPLIMLAIYISMYIVFVFASFFGGKIIGGSIYFVLFAINIAFGLLERKYNVRDMILYRISVLVSDLVNVFAASSLIYYGVFVDFFIATIVINILCFIIDLISFKNKSTNKKLRIWSVVITSLMMLAIFPYFFEFELNYSVALISAIFAGGALALKTAILFVKEKENKQCDNKLAEQISSSSDEIVE